MAINANFSPNYLSPVYSPVQYNFTTPVQSSDFSNKKYKLKIQFNSNAFVSGDYIILNNYKINFLDQTATTFTVNDIPIGISVSEKADFLTEIIDNNIYFDSFSNILDTTNSSQPFVTLTSIVDWPLSSSSISYSSSTTAITFSEVFPTYVYFGQLKDDFGIETKLSYDNTYYNFSTSFHIPLSTSTQSYLNSFYKAFQPNNQHIFNYESSLQNVCATDLYTLNTLTGNTNIAQRDTRSLHNFSVQTYNIYKDDFGIRRIIQDNFQDKWVFNSTKPVEFNTKPYYDTQLVISSLTSAATLFSYNVEFNYQPAFGDNVRAIATPFDFNYVCSSATSTDDRTFKRENTLTGTVNNFLELFKIDWNEPQYVYTVSYSGYSKCVINISAQTPSTDVTIISTTSTDKIKVETLVAGGAVSYYPVVSGSYNTIRFLTDRPNESSIYYDYFTNTIPHKPLVASIFLNAYNNTTNLNYDYCYFRVRLDEYVNGVWNIKLGKQVGPFAFSASQYNNLSAYNTNNIYHLNINPNIYEINSAATKVRLTVFQELEKGDENIQSYKLQYSEEKIFDIVKLCDYQVLKQFMFLNSLSGWDLVDLYEDTTTEYTRTQTLISNRTDKVSDVTDVETLNLQNFYNKVYKVSKIVNAEEYRWLYELGLSSQVYLVSGTNYIPVIITSINYIETQNINQYKLDIEYTISKTDKSQKSI